MALINQYFLHRLSVVICMLHQVQQLLNYLSLSGQLPLVYWRTVNFLEKVLIICPLYLNGVLNHISSSS